MKTKAVRQSSRHVTESGVVWISRRVRHGSMKEDEDGHDVSSLGGVVTFKTEEEAILFTTRLATAVRCERQRTEEADRAAERVNAKGESSSDGSKITTADFANLTAVNNSLLTAGTCSRLTGGRNSRLIAGYGSILTAGKDSMLVWHYWGDSRWRLVTAYVGENGIKPDTPYQLDENYKPVEVNP